jgi:hypothetical protein
VWRAGTGTRSAPCCGANSDGRVSGCGSSASSLRW